MTTMTDTLRHLLRVREAAVSGIRAHYVASGLTEVAVPVLVGITGACENVSTLFRLAGGVPVHLTQTGQLALEHALCLVEGVYCQTPSFRTDTIDNRHLSEFTLIEEEIRCDHPVIGMTPDRYDATQMFEELLLRISDGVKAIIAGVVTSAAADVTALNGDLDVLSDVLACDFRRVTYSDALSLLNCGRADPLPWGTDLSPVDESRLIDILARQDDGRSLPTLVTHFPTAIKFFNMRVDDVKNDVVQSVDLLLPGVGECVGGAVRENRYERLERRLLESVMFAHITERNLATLDDFLPYLDLIRERRVSPHAGYGIGLERVLQFIIGSPDIRRASVAYSLSDKLGFTRILAAAQHGSNAPGF